MGNRYTCLLIVSILMTVFLAVTISAQVYPNPAIISEPVFTQNENATVRLPCTANGTYCSANATCRTTIINPEGNTVVNNQIMFKNNAVFEVNVTAQQHSLNGEYQFNVVCSDAGTSVSRFLKYHVTPNGERATTSKGIMYISILAILVIFLVGLIIIAFRFEHIALKSGSLLSAYLMLIAISFISWNLALDYLTSSPFMISFFRIIFLFLLYAFFPIILISTFYTMWMMLKIKEIQRMLDDGMPYDEAYERTVKRGLKRKWF